MTQDWFTLWSKIFIKIAITETVFNWTFVGIIVAIAVVYLLWLTFRKQDSSTEKTSIFKRFFRFRWQEMLVYAGLTICLLIVVFGLGVSVVFHAQAFSEGMTRQCVLVEVQNESYIFSLPPECANRELLWNRVQISKEEGESAYNFLTKKENP